MLVMRDAVACNARPRDQNGACCAEKVLEGGKWVPKPCSACERNFDDIWTAWKQFGLRAKRSRMWQAKVDTGAGELGEDGFHGDVESRHKFTVVPRSRPVKNVLWETNKKSFFFCTNCKLVRDGPLWEAHLRGEFGALEYRCLGHVATEGRSGAVAVVKKVDPGDDLMARKILYAWRVFKAQEKRGQQGLGSVIPMGPNASRLRLQVGTAWLQLARLKIGRLRAMARIPKKQNTARLQKVFLSWATHAQLEINHYDDAHFRIRLQHVSAVLVRVFQGWGRVVWAARVERGVHSKVDAAQRLANAQEQVWAIRVAELEAALIDAKAHRREGTEVLNKKKNETMFYGPPSRRLANSLLRH
jgi:hypothetical protein